MKRIILTFVLLVLTMSSTLFSKPYNGAEYRTIEAFVYGRFEVCYKATKGSGQTSTFFLYHELGSGGTAEWNEIDIEVMGRYDNDVQFNTITPNIVNHAYHCGTAFDPTEDYHDYAIEWTPDYVAWFIDGEEVYRQTGDHIATLFRSQKMMMNLWQPTAIAWAGEFDPAILPLFAKYDYASYASYTPGAGDCGTDNNFSFQWRDDFDEFDNSRWQKATHTFEGNNCQFIKDNVIFEDGKMILCMTNSGQTGKDDTNTPFIRGARLWKNEILVEFSEELDPASAESVANFAVPGGKVTIENAALDVGGQRVKLTVSGADTVESLSVVALGIKDLADPANLLIGQSVTVKMPPVCSYPLKINVGGSAWGDYLADREWTVDADYGYTSGWSITNNSSITNTDDDYVFKTGMNDIIGYKVRVPDGTYQVTVLLNEHWFEVSGGRVLDIMIDTMVIATDFDIYTEAGTNTACMLTSDEFVSDDGIIDIHIGAKQDLGLLNGIIVEQISTSIEVEEHPDLQGFNLLPNYPNPFNNATVIPFIMPERGEVSWQIYNLRGELAASMDSRYYSPGQQQVRWTPDSNIADGIYFLTMTCRLNQNKTRQTGKLLYLK